MERLQRAIGPLATNLHVLADERSGEAIAIDTAIPSLPWITEALAARGWSLPPPMRPLTRDEWDGIFHKEDHEAL